MEKSKILKVCIALEKHAKTKKESVWKAVSNELKKPSRKQNRINLSKLSSLQNRFVEKTLIVPGKVLSSGLIEKPVFVAALEFSESARKKIVQAKGKAFNLSEFVKTNPQKSSVVIVK